MATQSETAFCEELFKIDDYLKIAIITGILDRLKIENETPELYYLKEVEKYLFECSHSGRQITNRYISYALEDYEIKSCLALRYGIIFSMSKGRRSGGTELMMSVLSDIGITQSDIGGRSVNIINYKRLSKKLFQKACVQLFEMRSRYPEIFEEINPQVQKLKNDDAASPSVGCILPLILLGGAFVSGLYFV